MSSNNVSTLDLKLDIESAGFIKHLSLLGALFFIGLHLAWGVKYSMPLAFLSTFSSAYFAMEEMLFRRALARKEHEGCVRNTWLDKLP